MKTAFLVLALASRVSGFVPLSRHIVHANRNNHLKLQMSIDDTTASSLDNSKVCLVTGASRGIGKCIALELSKADDNVKVVINDIEPMKEEAEQLCQEIKDAGGNAMVVTADCECTHPFLLLSILHYVHCFLRIGSFSYGNSFSLHLPENRLKTR